MLRRSCDTHLVEYNLEMKEGQVLKSAHEIPDILEFRSYSNTIDDEKFDQQNFLFGFFPLIGVRQDFLDQDCSINISLIPLA